MKNNIFIKILLIYLMLISKVTAVQISYFEEGYKLFEKKKFEKSKILFERDIVFNPKNEESYLYLAKIYNEIKNDEESEVNLNNVLLLNPQNDEAIYMLALLKIKQSDYDHAKKLINQFNLVCTTFCSKKNEIEEKFSKLIPDNAESKD